MMNAEMVTINIGESELLFVGICKDCREVISARVCSIGENNEVTIQKARMDGELALKHQCKRKADR